MELISKLAVLVQLHYIISTSSLNFQELFLHFHEVGEGKGKNDDDQSYNDVGVTCGGDP